MGMFGGPDVTETKTADPNCAKKVTESDKDKGTRIDACVDPKSGLLTSVTVTTGVKELTLIQQKADAVMGRTSAVGGTPKVLETNAEIISALTGHEDLLKQLTKSGATHVAETDANGSPRIAFISDIPKKATQMALK